MSSFDSTKNCYEAAGRLISTLRNSAFLCNGWIYSTKLKRMIRHAWVEDERTVWDYSNARRIIVTKQDYYREGKVERVTRYPRKDAIRMLQGTKRFEFWTQKQREKILGG